MAHIATIRPAKIQSRPLTRLEGYSPANQPTGIPATFFTCGSVEVKASAVELLWVTNPVEETTCALVVNTPPAFETGEFVALPDDILSSVARAPACGSIVSESGRSLGTIGAIVVEGVLDV